MKVNLKNLKTVNEVFRNLNNLRRWTDFVTEGKYNELAKQSLNCITAHIIALYCEKAGHKICWQKFPKIALYRAFQKVNVYFDIPESIIQEICQIGNIQKSEFDQATKELIRETTDDEFAAFICEEVNSYEMRIYRAATKIATLVELVENRFRIRDNDEDEYDVKMQEIREYLRNFIDIPGVKEVENIKGGTFKVLQQISKLRNQNRWAIQSYTVECSVLGHLFDSAILGYFIGLEYADENLATELFFKLIYHDVPETWTKDIPSPIKNYILGFREAVKKYEDKVLEEKFYIYLPDFVSNKIRQLLSEENPELKKLLKGADYLSADSECARQLTAGSRDRYYLEMPLRNFQVCLEEGKYKLPTVSYQLHRYFYEYAERLYIKF